MHWFQPHVYRELSRYGMKSDLVHCPDYTTGKNYYTFVTEHRKRDMSHEEEVSIIIHTLSINVRFVANG